MDMSPFETGRVYGYSSVGEIQADSTTARHQAVVFGTANRDKEIAQLWQPGHEPHVTRNTTPGPERAVAYNAVGAQCTSNRRSEPAHGVGGTGRRYKRVGDGWAGVLADAPSNACVGHVGPASLDAGQQLRFSQAGTQRAEAERASASLKHYTLLRDPALAPTGTIGPGSGAEWSPRQLERAEEKWLAPTPSPKTVGSLSTIPSTWRLRDAESGGGTTMVKADEAHYTAFRETGRGGTR